MRAGLNKGDSESCLLAQKLLQELMDLPQGQAQTKEHH